MPTNEKEYNGFLFDQLSMLERLERVAKREKSEAILSEIDFERKQIERKLYPIPPLISE